VAQWATRDAQYLGVVEPPDERRPETPCQRAAPLTLASPLLLLSTQEEPHMTWFRRRYGIADYGRAFEEFEALFNRLHGPRDMMMIKTELGDGTRVYLSVPDPKLVEAYPGFEPIDPAELPAEATLLIGHQDAFGERFRFPKRD
jgi:hypothetical protein